MWKSIECSRCSLQSKPWHHQATQSTDTPNTGSWILQNICFRLINIFGVQLNAKPYEEWGMHSMPPCCSNAIASFRDPCTERAGPSWRHHALFGTFSDKFAFAIGGLAHLVAGASVCGVEFAHRKLQQTKWWYSTGHSMAQCLWQTGNWANLLVHCLFNNISSSDGVITPNAHSTAKTCATNARH